MGKGKYKKIYKELNLNISICTKSRKINYTLILGDEEKNNNTISYRRHGEKDTTTVSIDEFIKLLKENVYLFSEFSVFGR